MERPATAVASVLVRDVLDGPVRLATVIAAGPMATYLDVAGCVLAVVAAGGVRLPCAAMLAGRAPLSGGADPAAGGARVPGGVIPAARTSPAPGAGLSVGGGAIHRGGRRVVEVGRWFDPVVRVSSVESTAVDRLWRLLRARPCHDALLPVEAVDELAQRLARHDAHTAVAALIGRGSGLTPAGDDLLAGALAALRALGSSAADELGDAVGAQTPGRTTRLSGALLEAANLGAIIPEAADVVRALSTEGANGARGRAGHARLEAATDRLVAIGDTSGWHLAAGLAVGAGLATARHGGGGGAFGARRSTSAAGSGGSAT